MAHGQHLVFLVGLFVTNADVDQRGREIKEEEDGQRQPEPGQKPQDQQATEAAVQQYLVPDRPGQLELEPVPIEPEAGANPDKVIDQHERELEGVEIETRTARKSRIGSKQAKWLTQRRKVAKQE